MKTNTLKIISMLMCIAVAFAITSCDREDGPSSDGGGDDNTPLTNETIVGKKFYTNKLPGMYGWCQSEIRFAANNVAYLTRIVTDYNTGEEDCESPAKAIYNFVYPDVAFEDEDGNIYPATFINNNTLIFTGEVGFDGRPAIDEEHVVMGQGTPDRWYRNLLKGWRFSSSSETITGPYAGQRFRMDTIINETHLSWDFYFGVNYACFHSASDYEGRLIVNYPNILVNTIGYWDLTIGESFFEGYFVTDSSFYCTKLFSNENCGYLFKRIR